MFLRPGRSDFLVEWERKCLARWQTVERQRKVARRQRKLDFNLGSPGSGHRKRRLSTGSRASAATMASSDGSCKSTRRAQRQEWRACFEKASETRPYLKCFTARKRQLLRQHGIREFPESACRVVDISQNFKFGRVVKEIVPCITPKGEKYLSHLCRPILGIESLRLQGFWPSNSELLGSFKESLLQNLAGNAFEASCFAAALWCTMWTLARCSNVRNMRAEQLHVPWSIESSSNKDSDEISNPDEASTESYEIRHERSPSY